MDSPKSQVKPLHSLLITLENRLSAQAQLLHHPTEVGGYGLTLEEIAHVLAQDTIAITGHERGICSAWPPR